MDRQNFTDRNKIFITAGIHLGKSAFFLICEHLRIIKSLNWSGFWWGVISFCAIAINLVFLYSNK